MPNTPDSDALLSAIIPFAEQLLAKHGEFFPFGASISADGKINMLAAMGDSDRPPSQILIDQLYSGIAQEANKGTIRGAAVCYDSRVIPPGSAKKVDAICIELEHVSEGCAKVFRPYQKGWRHSIKYGELFGVPLEPRAFIKGS